MVCVGIPTYQRPHLLRNLLLALENQLTDGLFEYGICIVDNDRLGSARPIVENHALRSKLDIHYDIEPERNIARVRNRVIANSKGDLIAFIDDDESPPPCWLINLYKALKLFETAGILGQVEPRYEKPPPQWVIQGQIFDRPSFYSGHFLNWWDCRTGNCLLKKSLFNSPDDLFRPEFCSGGEDRDFFKRMIDKGHVFVWCDEAPASEFVPARRWEKATMLKRALIRGKMTYLSQKHDMGSIMSSIPLLLLYALALPFLLIFSPVFGFETFMKHLVKSADHIGKLLALFHIEAVKETYIL